MTRTLLLLLSLLPLAVRAAEAAPKAIPLADFARHAQFQDIKISPDGHYFAAKVRKDSGNLGLVILDRNKGLAMVSAMDFDGKDSLGEFNWANNERLVMSLTRQSGALDAPSATGELYAMNADGSKKKMLFGYRAEREAMRAGASVVSWLPEDDKQILITSQPFDVTDAFYPTVYRLNIYSGRLVRVTRPPVRGNHVVADGQGNVRFAVGADLRNANETVVAYRDQNGEDWKILEHFAEEDGGFLPLAFLADGKRVLGLSDRKADTKGIAIYDPEAGKETLIFRDKEVDASPIFSIEKGFPKEVVGASIEKGLPEIVFIDTEGSTAFRADLKGLIAAFPQQRVNITSVTRDDKLYVVHVSADNDTGEFYLFDREAKQVRFLLSAMPWLEPNSLARTQAVNYKARDGQSLSGYLTLPQGKSKALPLVMMPHGGPHGVRDNWGYDPYVQVLASRGYAVFQPNFRGSGGFGNAFLSAGYKQWGTLMIDDMTDGVNYLIGQGVVDKDRICTMGGSYGGYAAVMSAEREPDLYRCAVGYVGVYDLEMLSSNPGAYNGLGSDNFRKKVLPDSEAELRAQSPRYQVAKLKAPVLIVAGGEDQIAPIEHSEALRDAMKAAGKPYEWYVEPKEGHGFYKPAHREELYKRVLTFLDKHIGQ